MFELVAHRGFAAEYPENTLVAFTAAIDRGVRFLELDVQLTADQVPVVLHDDSLLRTTGQQAEIFELTADSLRAFSAGEPERLGDKFPKEPIPLLADFVGLLQKHPNVHAFVEVKDECIEKFGRKVVLDAVLEVLEPVAHQTDVIAYDLEVLLSARARGWVGIGWVLTDYSEIERHQAETAHPDYLICNYKKINADLWPGPWQWFLYELTEPSLAMEWVGRGVSFIETMEVGRMAQALLRPREAS